MRCDPIEREREREIMGAEKLVGVKKKVDDDKASLLPFLRPPKIMKKKKRKKKKKEMVHSERVKKNPAA